MARVVLILTVLILQVFCFDLGPMPLRAYPSDESSSTEFRENLLPAQQGDAKAQVFVAYLYETGQGVSQNYSKAAEWYGKAAQQGNRVAQTQLGNMYRLGKGVTQSYVMAYMWLDLASQQGSAQAAALKKNVGGKMTGSQLAEAKKLLKNWKARK